MHRDELLTRHGSLCYTRTQLSDLRSQVDAFSNPDFIAFRANVFPEDDACCRAAGVDGFVRRPVESEALFATSLRRLARKADGEGSQWRSSPDHG
jgi:CheY-like chemotaxis protein